MTPAIVHKDAKLKFSKQLLNPDKHDMVLCPKCGQEIRNRYYMYANSRTFARCLNCDICYYLSKDRSRSIALQVVYE